MNANVQSCSYNEKRELTINLQRSKCKLSNSDEGQ